MTKPPTFSTAGRQQRPIRTTVTIRLAPEQYAQLEAVGAAVKPAASPNARTGVAEAVRQALDYWFALPVSRRLSTRPAPGSATQESSTTSLRLLPQEVAALDDEAGRIGARGRAAVLRAAVQAFLAERQN